MERFPGDDRDEDRFGYPQKPISLWVRFLWRFDPVFWMILLVVAIVVTICVWDYPSMRSTGG